MSLLLYGGAACLDFQITFSSACEFACLEVNLGLTLRCSYVIPILIMLATFFTYVSVMQSVHGYTLYLNAFFADRGHEGNADRCGPHGGSCCTLRLTSSKLRRCSLLYPVRLHHTRRDAPWLMFSKSSTCFVQILARHSLLFPDSYKVRPS